MENHLSYHNRIKNWHPQSHKLDCPSIATVEAGRAILEAEKLREKLRGRRILEVKDTRND